MDIWPTGGLGERAVRARHGQMSEYQAYLLVVQQSRQLQEQLVAFFFNPFPQQDFT
jgi:hypothetical protein